MYFPLKGQCHKTLCFGFLSPQPLKITLVSLQIFFENFKSHGAPPVSLTPVVNLPPVTLAFVDVVNNGNNIRLLTVHLEMNLKKKKYLYVNSTTQRCSNKVLKIFLTEDFFSFATGVNNTGGSH
jgi:hypothetical protein